MGKTCLIKSISFLVSGKVIPLHNLQEESFSINFDSVTLIKGLVHGYQVNLISLLSQQNLKDCLQTFRKLEALKTLVKLQITVP